MSRSTDFEHWDRERALVLYPDEDDGPSTSYLPGVGNVGVELHHGRAYVLGQLARQIGKL